MATRRTKFSPNVKFFIVIAIILGAIIMFGGVPQSAKFMAAGTTGTISTTGYCNETRVNSCYSFNKDICTGEQWKDGWLLDNSAKATCLAAGCSTAWEVRDVSTLKCSGTIPLIPCILGPCPWGVDACTGTPTSCSSFKTKTACVAKTAALGCAWTPTKYKLTTAKAGTSTGTITSSPSGISCGSDCTEDYVYGTGVKLTAAPSTGTFGGWSGACSGKATTCNVTMDGAKSVTATFNMLPNGESCTSHGQCSSSICYSGKCSAPLALGASCSSNIQCYSGYCLSGKCVATTTISCGSTTCNSATQKCCDIPRPKCYAKTAICPV